MCTRATIVGLLWFFVAQVSNGIETGWSYSFANFDATVENKDDASGANPLETINTALTDFDGFVSIQSAATEEASGSLKTRTFWDFTASTGPPNFLVSANVNANASATMSTLGTIIGPEASDATYVVGTWTVDGKQRLQIDRGASGSLVNDFSATVVLETNGVTSEIPVSSAEVMSGFLQGPEDTGELDVPLAGDPNVFDVFWPAEIAQEFLVEATLAIDTTADIPVVESLQVSGTANVDLSSTATFDGFRVVKGTFEEPIEINAQFSCDSEFYSFCESEPQPQFVDIDIKPGSDTNPINLGSNGNVPVAIFSAADFDATTIDPKTIALENAAVQLKGKKEVPQFSFDDINLDGLLDLVVHIDTEALTLATEDVTAALTGTTFDLTAITGFDNVRVMNPPESVPEPASAVILALGSLGFLRRSRRHRR